MKIEIDIDDECLDKVFVDVLKERLSLTMAFSGDEAETKAYLTVLADNMYIGDFKEYVKKENLEAHCQEIFQRYESYL